MTSVFVISPDAVYVEKKDVVEESACGHGKFLNIFKLQTFVGGYVELIVKNREGGKFSAYANDEAIELGMQENSLATKVLDFLDFDVSSFRGRDVIGNIVITGSDETGLDPDTIAALDALCVWFSLHDARSTPDLTEDQLHYIFNNGSKRPKHTIAEVYEEDEEESSSSSSEDSSKEDANPSKEEDLLKEKDPSKEDDDSSKEEDPSKEEENPSKEEDSSKGCAPVEPDKKVAKFDNNARHEDPQTPL